MTTSRPRTRVALAVFASTAAALLSTSLATAAGSARDDVRDVGFPASAVLLSRAVTAHGAPSASGRRIVVFSQYRKDFRPTVLQVLGESRDPNGRPWLKIAIPGRPNGRRGWVEARSVQVRAVTRRILVDVSARKLRVIEHGKTRFATRVAVGRRGAETPTGLFYVTAGFVPTERFLGAYAFETSAYSKLSEWPGGGVVGLHGTTMPKLLGKAVSHGCIRMSNAAVRTLRRLVTAGTPLRVVPLAVRRPHAPTTVRPGGADRGPRTCPARRGLPVGRAVDRGIDRDARLVDAVRVHHVELEVDAAVPAARERELRAIPRPRRVEVGPGHIRQANRRFCRRAWFSSSCSAGRSRTVAVPVVAASPER